MEHLKKSTRACLLIQERTDMLSIQHLFPTLCHHSKEISGGQTELFSDQVTCFQQDGISCNHDSLEHICHVQQRFAALVASMTPWRLKLLSALTVLYSLHELGTIETALYSIPHPQQFTPWEGRAIHIQYIISL